MRPVTFPKLKDEGATHFAWLKPFETLQAPPEGRAKRHEISGLPISGQPDHPDGSFLYRMRSGRHWLFPVAPR